MNIRNPYESSCWKTQDGAMHPGGLELTRLLLRLSGLQKGALVLDLGCGRGAATSFFAKNGLDAVGLDRSPSLLKEARAHATHLTFVEGNAVSIPYTENTFDAVLLECVLSIAPVREVMSECFRVTKESGQLLISDLYDLDGGGKPLSRIWWEAQLEAAGFRCAHFEDRTHDLWSFGAQMRLDFGSLDGLCSHIGCQLPEKPGYFALIAEKGGGAG